MASFAAHLLVREEGGDQPGGLESVSPHGWFIFFYFHRTKDKNQSPTTHAHPTSKRHSPPSQKRRRLPQHLVRQRAAPPMPSVVCVGAAQLFAEARVEVPLLGCREEFPHEAREDAADGEEVEDARALRDVGADGEVGEGEGAEGGHGSVVLCW